MSMKKTVALAALGLIAAGAALAASASQAPAPKEPLRIPRLTETPKIDGVLDNPIWETQALKIENFVQLTPKENGVPTEKTVAYLGYDEKNLYIAFRAFDSQSSKVRCSITKRDGCMEDDWVFAMLDTFNEKRRAFSFLINPAGVQMDMMRVEEGGNDNMDDSWDTVFFSDGKIDAEGYTVEMAIPFKSLRFPNDDLKTWNLVLGRNLPRTGEVILYESFSRDIPGLLTQGKPFVIQGAVERSRNVEVMPFLTSLKSEGDKVQFEPGANLKLGLSSNATLDATINPDFSQIEADEPKIDYNVRYALRYDEKRPFFLEGMEIFSSPEIETVYTRQINDPIFGAKASGKTGRFTYGVLSAYDMHPTESLWDISEGSSITSETKAFSNIFRTKADVGSGSYVGFTLTDKELGAGNWNRLGGFDGQLRFKDRVFFSFQALASDTSTEGVRTSLVPGLYGELYYTDKHWTFGGFYKAMDPEFQASLGFVNRVDYRSAGGFASYRLYPDKKYLNQVQFRIQAGQRIGYADSVTQDTWIRPQVQFRLTEFNQVFVMYEAADGALRRRRFQEAVALGRVAGPVHQLDALFLLLRDRRRDQLRRRRRLPRLQQHLRRLADLQAQQAPPARDRLQQADLLALGGRGAALGLQPRPREGDLPVQQDALGAGHRRLQLLRQGGLRQPAGELGPPPRDGLLPRRRQRLPPRRVRPPDRERLQRLRQVLLLVAPLRRGQT